jgi:hypothetical protein
MTDIELSVLLGNTARIKVLGVILPLEGEEFTAKQVAAAVRITKKGKHTGIDHVLDAFVNEGILIRSGGGRSAYSFNQNSKRVWALNQMVHAMFSDSRRLNSMRAMGMIK